MSVGADGVILIEPSDTADFKMAVFQCRRQSAGHVRQRCPLCGPVRLHLHDIAGPQMTFETLAGVIEAVVGDGG
jgi:diaminopimelate epimerase